MDERIKTISYNAIICALYVAITLLSYPISFQAIQFRISELLLILCFFRKDYTAGLTLGCIISNLFSSLGPIDALFGGVATLLSCLLIGLCKHLVVAVLIPVIANGKVKSFVGIILRKLLPADRNLVYEEFNSHYKKMKNDEKLQDNPEIKQYTNKISEITKK